MICPQCGYDMGNKSKCLRCGYEVKTLAVVDEHDRKEDKKENTNSENEVKVIDPCNVYLTHPYGYEDEADTGFGPFGNPFSSLFDDLFGDPISDLLGGLFGLDLREQREEEERPTKPQKKKGPIVEVDDVEIIEDEPKHAKPHAENTGAHAYAGHEHRASEHKETHGAGAHDERRDERREKKSKNPFRRKHR